jgi:hypothetical protein
MMADGASDPEVVAAIAVSSPKYYERAERSPTAAERYVAGTVANARRVHERSLTRVFIGRAYLDVHARDTSRPACAVVQLALETPNGTRVRARAVAPSRGYDRDARRRSQWDAFAWDVDPERMVLGCVALLRRTVVGRELRVALREGHVVWMQPRGGRR